MEKRRKAERVEEGGEKREGERKDKDKRARNAL